MFTILIRRGNILEDSDWSDLSSVEEDLPPESTSVLERVTAEDENENNTDDDEDKEERILRFKTVGKYYSRDVRFKEYLFPLHRIILSKHTGQYNILL